MKYENKIKCEPSILGMDKVNCVIYNNKNRFECFQT